MLYDSLEARVPESTALSSGNAVETTASQTFDHSQDSAADKRLMRMVIRTLQKSGYPALRAIDVDVRKGVVVLWGSTPSYYLKQQAQVLALRIAGVQSVTNGIVVISH